MKKIMFIISILLSAQFTYSNSTFDTIISHVQDERINDIVEFENFYILSGSIKNGNSFSSYVVKLSKNGYVLKDTMFDDTSVSLSVFNIDNEIVLFRTGNLTSPNQAYFIYTKMDTSLNIIFEKELSMPPGLYASRYNVTMNSDSNFVITGTINTFSSPPPNLNIFLYKVSSNGDSLNSLFMNGSFSSMRNCYGVAEKDKRNFAFISNFSYSSALGVFLIVDSNLNIIDTVNIPDDLKDNFSPKLINDSIFIICTRGIGSTDIYISKIDETGQIIDSRNFGKSNSLLWPSYQNSLSVCNKNIFFLANVDFCATSPFFGIGDPSRFMIGKLDINLDTMWLKLFGGNYYYHAFNILATSDGGCISIGTFNDTINHNNNRDIFVIKLDSTGSSTWIRTIKIPEPTIKIFPNPCNDYFTILYSLPPYSEKVIFSLYNSVGVKVKEMVLPSNTQQFKINTSSLTSGIYFGALVVDGDVVGKAKVVVTRD